MANLHIEAVIFFLNNRGSLKEGRLGDLNGQGKHSIGITRWPWPPLPLVLDLVPLQKFPIDLLRFSNGFALSCKN